MALVIMMLSLFTLADKEVKPISIVLASALTKEVKPIFSLDSKIHVHEIKDEKKRFFILIDETNSKAYVIRDDSEDFALILATIKARLFFIFNLFCGSEKDFRFAYDKDAFYIIAKDEKSKPKVSNALHTIIIKIPLRGKSFYLPIRYMAEYRKYVDMVSVKGFAIVIYYKDYSRLMREILRSFYSLRAG